MYRDLDPKKLSATLEWLHRRILERFPGSGLSKVCAEILVVSRTAGEKSEWIGRPIIPLRAGVGAAVTCLLAVTFFFLSRFQPEDTNLKFNEFVQMLEAGINVIVLVGAAIYFLISVESRIKRNRALELLNDLRSFSHVIDMHQLAKTPDSYKTGYVGTTSSPASTLSVFELTRYLDYCTELLSLTGKIAALYTQRFHDAEVFSAVKEVEDLTNGLSRKIWQKIMILQKLD